MGDTVGCAEDGGRIRLHAALRYAAHLAFFFYILCTHDPLAVVDWLVEHYPHSPANAV